MLVCSKIAKAMPNAASGVIGGQKSSTNSLVSVFLSLVI